MTINLITHWIWLSLQKLDMTDFMAEDVKFTLWTRETDMRL